MISWSNWRLSCNTVGSVTTEGRHVVSSSSSLSLWVPGGNNELLRPNCPPSCTAARTKSKEPLHTGSLFGRALELGRQLASGNHEQLYIVHTKRWMRKQTWLGQRWNREHIKWSIPNQCDNCFNFFTWEHGRGEANVSQHHLFRRRRVVLQKSSNAAKIQIPLLRLSSTHQLSDCAQICCKL